MSTNGTRLNGKRLPRPPFKHPMDARVRIFHGDELVLAITPDGEELGFVVNLLEPRAEIRRKLRAPGGVDILLFVLKKERITAAEQETLAYVTQLLFGPECLPNLYMVVTHAGRLARDAECREQWLQEQVALSAHFGAMVAHLGAQPLSRLLFVDNMDPKEAEEEERQLVEKRRHRALQDIYALLRRHRAPPFRHSIMRRAGELQAAHLESIRKDLKARIEAELRKELDKDRGDLEAERRRLQDEVEDQRQELREKEEEVRRLFELEWSRMRSEFEERAKSQAREDLEHIAKDIVDQTETKACPKAGQRACPYHTPHLGQWISVGPGWVTSSFPALVGQNEDLDEVIRTNHSVDVMSHMFAKVDSNGDGMISQEEWALGMQEHPMVLLETSELKEAAIKAGTWRAGDKERPALLPDVSFSARTSPAKPEDSFERPLFGRSSARERPGRSKSEMEEASPAAGEEAAKARVQQLQEQQRLQQQMQLRAQEAAAVPPAPPAPPPVPTSPPIPPGWQAAPDADPFGGAHGPFQLQVWDNFRIAFKQYMVQLAGEALQQSNQEARWLRSWGSFQVCVSFLTNSCRRGLRCTDRHPPRSQWGRLRRELKRKACAMGEHCCLPQCAYFHPREGEEDQSGQIELPSCPEPATG
ncbi:unnamed protein product [Effrenium voratum]|nr:unnamed protein product [Effrenium voratum]